ncbi:MAG: undecaprenyldiphospho-muramoylpentapeptide beta-N-acetylglucosaminyltransferase [Geminicoccaceae bacterium]|nr:MAG: undecaprenyldiphospho-muramoylpentapeptide beta-N-acetylglucosaminyltransferase [Geminicoccaceae bacterium]
MRGAVVIASGGTGGHMFPAVALGDALERRGQKVAYAVDARGLRYLPEGARHWQVQASSPTGSLAQKLQGLLVLGLGFAQSLVRFLIARPKAVAAFGGYAAVPTGLAAGLLRVPLVLHEQNAVFGRAHRLLLRFARTVALSFEPTAGAPATGRLVGNPVRAGFAPSPWRHAPDQPIRLFVVGGSQGASAFADVVPAAITALGDEARRLRVTQQCRPEDLERVRMSYAEAGIDAETASFFDDMPARLEAADLVLTRAGASAVAETLVVGRPMLLVPYKFAADDHQRANAKALEAEGAALVIDPDAFTAEALTQALDGLLDAPERLARMAAAAAGLARVDAAETLADLVVEASR